MFKKYSVHISFLIIFSMILTAFISTSATVEANDMFALVGFATLNGGTTGGTGGTVVEATSLSQVNNLLSTRRKNNDTSPLIIKFNRKITGSEAIVAKEVSNITFLGVGTGGELEGVGINIVRSKNIIVQNLKIHHALAPMDCIGIENSRNIWIDHCELYNVFGDCNGDGIVDTRGDIEGGDVDWYDGLLDVKGESEYITVSWTYFHDSFKTSLVGSSDSDIYDRKITFHHNIYSNVRSRLPSYRGGTGHIFNNYYVNVEGSAINSRVGAKLRIENNVFENVGSGSMDSSGFAEGPIGSYYSSSIGYWDVKNNLFINCKGNQPTTSTCSFTPPYNYSNVLHPVEQVKSIVTQYAGVGKIDGSSVPTARPTVNNTTPIPANSSDIVYGDLNGDGNANSLDFATLKKYLVGSIQLSESQLKASDLNLDGNVNSLDYAHFKRYLLGMINSLPVVPVVVTPTPTTATPTPTNIIPTPTSHVKEGDIVLEPNGSMTLEQAIKSIQPGNTIYLKSGTYKYSKTIVIAEGNNGYAGAYKKIASYGNEKPILDFSAMAENSSNRGIVLAGNYWHIKNIAIHGAGDNGMLVAGHNNIIEACNFMYNRDSGLQLSRYNSSYNTKDKWPSNNLIIDCYSAENMDSGAEDADGFAAKLTCGEGNVFRNCKAEYNCDDGWDLYTKSNTGAIGVVTIENCEASNNGKYRSGKLTGGDGNGFKLGDDTASVPHVLKNCTANYNVKHGFTGNGNPARIVLENCSGTGNGGKLFDRLTNAIFR